MTAGIRNKSLTRHAYAGEQQISSQGMLNASNLNVSGTTKDLMGNYMSLDNRHKHAFGVIGDPYSAKNLHKRAHNTNQSMRFSTQSSRGFKPMSRQARVQKTRFMSSHNIKAYSPKSSSHINLKIKDFNIPTSDLHKINSRKKLDQSNVSSSIKSVPKPPQPKQQKPRPVTAKVEQQQPKPQSRIRENI